MSQFLCITACADIVRTGGVIAYPTEAVFGLGCDPLNEHAVKRLLNIKQRPVSKGLILIASDVEQIKPYIDHQSLSLAQLEPIYASWPGPYTWVMPASDLVPSWIKGNHASIAVRVSAHPDVQALCQLLNAPIVSTSANLTQQPATTTAEQTLTHLGDALDGVMCGMISGNPNPSTIRDAVTGHQYR